MSLLQKISPLPKRAAHKVLKLLSSMGFDQRIQVPPDAHVSFALVYKDMVIGHLSLRDGRWSFAYTDEFRSSRKIKPLMMFPDVEKVYQSEELWPFFQMRIPSLKQPVVRALIEKEHIDQNNLVELLRRFGRRHHHQSIRAERDEPVAIFKSARARVIHRAISEGERKESKRANHASRASESGWPLPLCRKLCMLGSCRPSLAIRYEKQARVSPTPNGDARVYAH